MRCGRVDVRQLDSAAYETTSVPSIQGRLQVLDDLHTSPGACGHPASRCKESCRTDRVSPAASEAGAAPSHRIRYAVG
jgi:hypothetical protein